MKPVAMTAIGSTVWTLIFFGWGMIGASAAHAHEPVISVSTKNLDLTTPAGREHLRYRLRHAVSDACPFQSKCRASALSGMDELAERLIAAAGEGRALPNSLRIRLVSAPSRLVAERAR